MYIPPVAHIKQSFGGRGEAGKYGVYSQRDHITSSKCIINNNVR